MTAAVLLASARAGANQTQRGLAQASGKVQSAIAAIESGQHDTTTATLTQLLIPCGYKLTVLPSLAPTVLDAASELAEYELDSRASFRMIIGFVDQLRAVDAATRVGLCLAEPRPTDSRWDPVLAGAVDYVLRGLPKPVWLSHLRWSSEVPVYVDNTESTREYARLYTPVEFAKRNVFVAETEFASA